MTTTLEKRAPLVRAVSYLRPHAGGLSTILGLTLVGSLAAAFEPLVLKSVIDALTAGNDARALGLGAAALLGIALLREAITALTSWLTWRTRLRIHHELLDRTVERLHTLPVGFHREHGVGELMTRLDRGIQGFLGALGEIAFNVLPAVVYLVIAAGIMIDLDARLAVIALVFTPVPALLAVRAAPAQSRQERQLMNRWGKIYGRFNEVLSGILTVRSFAMEDYEKRRFLNNVNDANGVVLQGVASQARVSAGQGVAVAFARLSALGAGGWFVLQGECTIGTLMAFQGYFGGLFGPVQGLTGVYRTVRRASVSVEEVYSILDAHDHLGDAPDAHEVSTLRGEVKFERVCFGYRPEQPSILRNIEIDVRPGQRIALVGPSGAGKTTLMALLQRFYDPTSGVIRLDGHDLRKLKQTSVRRNIGVVLQDAILFDDSVRANIGYGVQDARFADVILAAKTAHAHEFIERLPLGYETSVGERGNRLSGGERQRIAIARALLKNPPVLILDEATSALDAESEALVQDALELLVQNRTTFVIAHRLSTVIHADQILVLKDGSIIESGRHEELIRQPGYYASLVARQTRGLLMTDAA